MDRVELSEAIAKACNEGSTTLDLSRKGLITLPPDIGNLTGLTRLNLSSNQLTTLPPEIGNLTNLTRLDLASNQLTSLPPEIGNLTNLTRLDLVRNQLTSLPPEIGNLASLTSLSMGYNQITVLPPEIGNLIGLESLNLNANQLSTLPPEIGNLTGLDSLSLGHNQVMELPPEIGNLTSLTWLDLSENHLVVLPPQMENLTGLTDLDLLRNQRATSVPEREDMRDTVRIVIEEWLVEEGLRGLPWWDKEDAELDINRLTAQVLGAATTGIYRFLQEKFGYTSAFDDEMEEWFVSIHEDVGDLASSWKFWLEEQSDLSPDLHPIFQDIGDFWETALNTIVEAALPNIAQEVGLSVDGAITQTNAMLDALSTAAKHFTTKAVTENLGQQMAEAALDPVGEIVSVYLDYVDQEPGVDVDRTIEEARAQIQLAIKEAVDASTNYTVASFSIKLSDDRSSMATDLVSEIVARSRQDDGH